MGLQLNGWEFVASIDHVGRNLWKPDFGIATFGMILFVDAHRLRSRNLWKPDFGIATRNVADDICDTSFVGICGSPILGLQPYSI